MRWSSRGRSGPWLKGSGYDEEEELSMPKEAERYVCEKCKQEILIVKAGHCIPQC